MPVPFLLCALPHSKMLLKVLFVSDTLLHIRCYRNLSLIKTPSQLESIVHEDKLPLRIIEEESDVCELDEGRRVCWGETANLGRVIPR
jgi:hypothetical protein